jgi:hypothetical protein
MNMDSVEPYFSDSEVAKLLDPSGTRVKARSIRSEREAGRLIGTRIAGKWLYRQSDVLAFLEAARRCPAPTQDRNSFPSARRAGADPCSTSGGPRTAEAGNMLPVNRTLLGLRKFSRNGSPNDGGSDDPAQVIQIKS